MPDTPAARLLRGAFVTLRAAGALRGCIGRVAADRPLGHVVRDLAVAAARDDPRFAPVTVTDVLELEVEISVLSAPVALTPVRPEAIVVGRDGLIVRLGPASGLLLPQVAVHEGLGPSEFLAATCRKAGLPAAAWRDPAAAVQVFQAEVFGETA